MMNVLLINQLAIDFYTCITIIVTYTVDIFDIYLSGMSGYLLCLILSGEQLMWIGMCSSAISVVVITIERYVKIVHSVWHKNHFKRWMAYSGCVFSWTSGFVGNFFPFLFTTYISDGQCMPVMQFPSQSYQLAYAWSFYLYYFQLPLLIFIVCYVRIFQVIRRQNRVFQQANVTRNTANVTVPSATGAAAGGRKLSQSEMNALKTMISITVFLAVSWMPNEVYFVIQMTDNLPFVWPLWYSTLFFTLLNVCVNPFIYIVSYDDLRVHLQGKLATLRQMFRGPAVSNQSASVTEPQFMPAA
jgi:7 transmembrane receptor (rhodopsin family)